MKHLCRNCATFFDRKLKICPKCGTPIKALTKEKDIKKAEAEPEANIASKAVMLDESAYKIEAPQIDRSKIKYVPKSKRIKPEETIRVEGVHIDVRDVCYFEGKGKTRYARKKSVYTPSSSPAGKKTRKDYEMEKLEWWEIYRFADRCLAKRKINKYVKKEGRKKPENLSYVALLILCFTTGFLGLHQIYAKNYKRGIVMCTLMSIALFVVTFADKWAWLKAIQYSIGAGCGFVALLMWVSDIINLLFKRFQFQTSRLAYIKTLDVETRARLGKKYI